MPLRRSGLRSCELQFARNRLVDLIGPHLYSCFLYKMKLVPAARSGDSAALVVS